MTLGQSEGVFLVTQWTDCPGDSYLLQNIIQAYVLLYMLHMLYIKKTTLNCPVSPCD